MQDAVLTFKSVDENLTLIVKTESYFADFPVMVLAFKSVMWMKTCGQFNNTFTSVIYKCSYFFNL